MSNFIHFPISMLGDFQPIGIDTLLERAELMDRNDQKFVFHKNKLPEILNACCEEYFILEINGSRQFEYETEYFDTPSQQLYFDHHRGKGNRYKVRRRKYGSTGEEYIEVKHKTHKGNTQKHRIETYSLLEAKNLLGAHLAPALINHLQTSLMVHYQRITLLHKAKNEKVTLDFDLQMTDPSNKMTSSKRFENLIIAEAKSTHLQQNTFQKIAKKLGIREGSLSKYCLGCLAIKPNIKHNRFKQTYKHILSIEHA